MENDLSRQYEADFSERIINDIFGNDKDFEIMRLTNEDKGKYLDIEGLKTFLKGVPKAEDILWLLKDLKLRGELLPDFITKHKESGIVEFHEVKHWKKIKLSQVDQKVALKELAEEGFMCFVINVVNVQGFELSKYMEDSEIRMFLKLYGQEKKNHGVIVKREVPIQTRYKQRDTIYPLIKIVDFEWRFPINNLK